MTTTAADLTTLEPKLVWEIFSGIAATPRPSKREEKIRAHLRNFATERGLGVREDAVGNMVIEAPASAGCEGAPPVVLQGHVDMVCEKNRGTEHDFDNEGIKCLRATDETGASIIKADGTTLGADNGMGVALALAAALDDSVKRPKLEILLTVDEEAGMTGAKALKPDLFTGRRLINLDSEEDDAIYMGCAGGVDTTLRWTLPLDAVGGDTAAFELTVRGLRGGHSGGDIHENRGNANKILARTLAAVEGVRLAEIHGGSKRNAIPREAGAVVVCPSNAGAALKSAAERVQASAREATFEANLAIEVSPVTAPGNALSDADTQRFLRCILGLPHGVIGMHPKVPGLVQTSNNVATIEARAEGDQLAITVGTLTRSSSSSWLHTARDQVAAVGELAGATVASGNEYPGWEPNPESPLLATTSRIYRELFGAEAHVAAIHAGLECGIIRERVGEMDMVSFGPTIRGAHSPDEHIQIESVGKIWKLLRAVLSELASG